MNRRDKSGIRLVGHKVSPRVVHMISVAVALAMVLGGGASYLWLWVFVHFLTTLYLHNHRVIACIVAAHVPSRKGKSPYLPASLGTFLTLFCLTAEVDGEYSLSPIAFGNVILLVFHALLGMLFWIYCMANPALTGKSEEVIRIYEKKIWPDHCKAGVILALLLTIPVAFAVFADEPFHVFIGFLFKPDSVCGRFGLVVPGLSLCLALLIQCLATKIILYATKR